MTTNSGAESVEPVAKPVQCGVSLSASDLSALELALAVHEGWTPGRMKCDYETGPDEPDDFPVWYFKGEPFISIPRYTRDGAEAMRLLEKYRLTLVPIMDGSWRAQGGWHDKFQCPAFYGHGPTPAVAICRAVVALSEQVPQATSESAARDAGIAPDVQKAPNERPGGAA